MSALLQDLKLTARQLARRPVFALTAILTLAIGIGVNAVAFTVVNGILFKGPPTRDAKDIGRIVTTPGTDEDGNASLAEFDRFAEATRPVLDIAAEGRSTLAWRHDGTTQTAWVLFVSPVYFSLVTARPIVGDVNIARGTDILPSAVIGERFWRTQLGAPSIAGLTLRLNNVDVYVRAVLPESFRGPAGLYSPDIWLALDELIAFNTAATLQNRDERWLFVFGRMRNGATSAAIQGHVDAAVAAMARDWPDTHRERAARFRMLNDPNSELRGLSTASAVMMGIISLVLLIACFNVANLLLARAVERERDLGIRAAIGAGTWRLLQLVMTEAFAIAVLAGVAALMVARWTQALVGSFAIPIEQPQHIDLAPDWTVLWFIAVLVLIAAVLPGIWPALTAARVDTVRVLGSHSASIAGARSSRARQWLVAAQVSGSTAFLIVAALLAQSYAFLTQTDFGFAKNNLVVADFYPASHGYDPIRTDEYLRALTARISALPGVTRVAVADRAPFFIGYERTTLVSSTEAACAVADCPRYATMAVGPGYFNAMGVRLLDGREFAERGNPDEVVINQPLANLHWPDGQAVGQILRLGTTGRVVTVVGVTARSLTRTLDRERPTLYVRFAAEHLMLPVSLVTRSATAPSLLVRPITDAAQALDPNVAMHTVKTMERRLAVQLWPFRTASSIFGICGALALLLATAGLTGVVIHAVQRRVREFGVRLSVGAAPRDLMVEVLRGAVKPLVPGVVIGIAVAAAVTQLLQAAFVGVNVLNPLTFLAVAGVQVLIVLLACLGPAHRASRTDPLTALRTD